MDRRADILRHFPKMLARWKGAQARLWTLTSSLPTLTILLTKPDDPGCLLIRCGSPDRIESPQHWADSDIQIELGAQLFCVIDKFADVRISECEVSLTEMKNKPWDNPSWNIDPADYTGT